MKKYLCEACGYIYDPEVGDPDNGVEAGTAFEDIPEDWLCPLCGLGKDAFVETEKCIKSIAHHLRRMMSDFFFIFLYEAIHSHCGSALLSEARSPPADIPSPVLSTYTLPMYGTEVLPLSLHWRVSE